MKKNILLAVGLACAAPAAAQELQCQVSILTPTIQTSDRRIFTTLQTAIIEFLNNRKWTQDEFKNQERIQCSMQITIDERPSNDEFRASIQVQANRPVFNSSYDSPIFNFKDNNFSFRYLEYQPLDFSESGTNPNLTAVLAFYAYIILGIDYDSFSELGGGAYFQKAQNIVAAMQSAPESGWKAFESTRNRYWLAENYNNPVYRPVRELYYKYHRQGLDRMTEKKEDAIASIVESIEGLKRLHNEQPTSFLMQTLFDAKADEIVNVLSGAFPAQKQQAVKTLADINPANISKYQGILKN
jgi:hypothetical protein